MVGLIWWLSIENFNMLLNLQITSKGQVLPFFMEESCLLGIMWHTYLDYNCWQTNYLEQVMSQFSKHNLSRNKKTKLDTVDVVRATTFEEENSQIVKNEG